MKLHLAVLFLLAAALGPATAADARPDYTYFDLDVRGSSTAAWEGPGETTCAAVDPATLRGSVRETATFGTPRPVRVRIDGLQGSRGPLRVLSLADPVNGQGVPMTVHLTREGGGLEHVTCAGVQPLDAASCFGTASYRGDGGLGFTSRAGAVYVGIPDPDPRAVLPCPLESWQRPASLLRGSVDEVAFEQLAGIRRWLTTATERTPALVLRLGGTTECTASFPGCRPATREATVTLKVACRPTARKRCQNPRRRLR